MCARRDTPTPGVPAGSITHFMGEKDPSLGESPVMLLILTFIIMFALGTCKTMWTLWCKFSQRCSVVQGCKVMRTIKATFCRESYLQRFADSSGCSHSGILFNAALMHIHRCAEVSRREVHFTRTLAWRNKPSVLFLFDPLKSDSHLVLGPLGFEHLGDYCVNAKKRALDERKRLHRYRVTRLPTAGSWMPVTDDIEVTYQRRRVDEDDVKRVEHMLHLRSASPNAADRLDEFVQQSLHHYITELPGSVTTQRFLYQSIVGEKTLCFKKSPLPVNKTFDTLFFRQKGDIMELLDRFLEKKEHFIAHGFPHTIGFLVHGPRGTGKTSLAAAIASYTARHVISLRLSFVTNNQQLYDTFLSCRLKCSGEEPFFFSYSDVIFLLDDVDPNDPLIRRRLPAKGETLEESKEVGDGNGAASHKLSNVTQTLENDNAVNLSTLLGVLDGVVDTSSRIVIMVTRDPQNIDPALLRSGRFGKNIHMDYMQRSEIIQLLDLHFGDKNVCNASECSGMSGSQSKTALVTGASRKLHQEQVARVNRCIAALEPPKFSISGAVAESMCLAAESLDGFLTQLRHYQHHRSHVGK